MYVFARRHAALGRVFLRLLAAAALTLLAAVPALAFGISDVPRLPEGRPSVPLLRLRAGPAPDHPPGLRPRRARLPLDRHPGWRGGLQRPFLEDGRHAEPGGVEQHPRHPGRRGRLDVVRDEHRPRPSARRPMDPVPQGRGPALQPVLCLPRRERARGRCSGRERTRGSRSGTARPGGARRPDRPAFPTSGSALSSLSRRTRARSSGSGPDRGLARRAGGRWTAFPAGSGPAGGRGDSAARDAGLRRPLRLVGRDRRRRSRAV